MSVKAFDLIPAIEREQLIGDKSSNTTIECIECSGNNFYIGTSDASIIHYTLRETVQPSGRVGITATKIGLKFLAPKKAIVQLRCASAIERLLVLTDNCVFVLHSESLETLTGTAGIRPIKNVSSFCLNENPVTDDPFAVFICVAGHKKKAIQLFSISEDKVTPLFEKSLPDFPVNIAWDGKFVCAALMSQYVMLTIGKEGIGGGSPTGGGGVKMQELFPYEGHRTKPVVKRISKEEFLLGGPSALGMFVTGQGISERPPLQWSDRLVSVAFCHPYVLALNDEFVTIHSILDYTQKQAISFIGGVALGDFDGKIFIASAREIYALFPVSWEKQVQGLLEDGRVDEALDLAQNSRVSHSSSISGLSTLHRVRLQAGFIRFRDAEFEQAKQLLRDGDLDVRELVSLYPLLLPADSDFTRSVPPLHEMADITQIAKSDPAKTQAFKDFLVSYLEDLRPATHSHHPHARDINSALVKLYAEAGAAKIAALLEETQVDQHAESDVNLDYIGCEQWLKTREHHHASALLAWCRGSHEAALDTWVQLVDGQLEDATFQGLTFVVDQICSIPNCQLVMRYSDWALSKDQLLGVKIFTNRSDSDKDLQDDVSAFKPEIIIKRLHNRFPKALVRYLEYIIFEKKIENEEFHTHLALMYYEKLLDIKKSSTETDVKEMSSEELQLHVQLRLLLKTSKCLRLQLLLGKTKNQPGFEREEALLHGKVGDHSKALQVFVHRLKDVGAAESYCKEFASTSDNPERTHRKLVIQLFQVFLDPSLSPSDRDLLAAPAVNLLNQSDAFSSGGAKVLQMIPDHWSVTLLAPFLLKTVRSSLHDKRTVQIGKNIAQTNLNNTMVECRQTKHSKRIDLAKNISCPVCNEVLVANTSDESQRDSKTDLHCYPNGMVTHSGCGSRNRKTCPVTGQVFSL